MLRLYLLCLVFFVDGLGDWMGESFDDFIANVIANCARYRMLIDGGYGVIKAIKNPCGGRGFYE